VSSLFGTRFAWNPTRHSRAGLQIVPSLRDWLRRVFRVSRRGPQNRRSLGFARDDKGKGTGSIKSSY
jgi:hypothetical protein